MTAEHRNMLDSIKGRYGVVTDEEVFIKAYEEIIGGASGSDNARMDYRIFAEGLPHLPPYVRAVYAALLVQIP